MTRQPYLLASSLAWRSMPLKSLEPPCRRKKPIFLPSAPVGILLAVHRLVHDHAQVPVHAEHVDAENILGALDRDVGQAQDFFGVLDALFAGDKFRWLPGFQLAIWVLLVNFVSTKR